MGILDKIRNLLKKEWVYELQVYENGWVSITGQVNTKKKEDFQQLFEPGKLYRLMRRDPDSMKFDKVVWRHFEPEPVIRARRPKRERERESHPPPRELTPADVMKQWAEGLYAHLEPLRHVGQIVKDIREAFSGMGFGGGGEQQLPPLEFEGKAPWFMHPYVAKSFGDVIKEVIDHGFNRLERFASKVQQPIAETQPQVTAQFPSLEEYEYEEEVSETEQPAPEEVAVRTEVEVKPAEEETRFEKVEEESYEEGKEEEEG